MWMNGNLADELATKSEKKIDRIGTEKLKLYGKFMCKFEVRARCFRGG